MVDVPPARSPPHLPTYEELQTERTLKDSFAQLARDHDDIQGLFKNVAKHLETTPEIGEDHALSKEWDRLFKRHRKLYKDSQLNADQCASFLSNYSTILVPLSRGAMTIREKRLMINKFIEAIPAHQESARLTSERFHELEKQIEIFPTKVASYLRQEADKQGFWSHFWLNVQDVFMMIWETLHSALNMLIKAFRLMLSHILKIQFSCFAVLRVDIELRDCSQSSTTTTAKSTLKQARQDCEEIVERLCGFEDAWHMVRVSCNRLLETVEMATISDIVAFTEAYMKNAEEVYRPLIHCLRTYASGRSPF